MKREAETSEADAQPVTEATHVVFDLEEVRFRRHGSTMVAVAASGEALGFGRSDNGDLEAALAALDDAIERAHVWRAGTKVKVGFYNPHTAEFSFGPSYRSKSFRASTPVPIHRFGTVVSVDDTRVVDAEGTPIATLRPAAPPADEIAALFARSRDRAASFPR